MKFSRPKHPPHLVSPGDEPDFAAPSGKVLKMLALAAAGGALEFYDFVTFVFLADVIGVLFFPPGLPTWLTTVQTFGIFAAGYIFRPLGGVVLAHFGDLFGRKRVFAFSILLMAASTLAVAFLPVYKTIGLAAPFLLLILRILQGIAIGGEVPGAWTFVSEHVPANRVGWACGLICAGLAMGILLSLVIAVGMTVVLSPADILSFGWRFPFLLGGAFGLLGMQLRRMLQETPVFVALRTRKMLVLELPLRVVVRAHKRGVIISILCTLILSAAVVMLTLMLPTILQGLYHYSRQQALIATTISTLSLAVGLILAGVLVDHIGPAKLFVMGGLLLAVGDFAFANIGIPGTLHLYLSSAIVGFSGAVTAGVPVVMVSSFPASVRFTGVSFSYNVSYAIFGGLTPVTVATLMAVNPMSHVYYLICISGLTVSLGGYLWLYPDALRYRRGASNP